MQITSDTCCPVSPLILEANDTDERQGLWCKEREIQSCKSMNNDCGHLLVRNGVFSRLQDPICCASIKESKSCNTFHNYRVQKGKKETTQNIGLENLNSQVRTFKIMVPVAPITYLLAHMSHVLLGMRLYLCLALSLPGADLWLLGEPSV